MKKSWSIPLAAGLIVAATTTTALMVNALAQSTVTVKIWGHLVSQAPAIQKELDIFMKENPGIKVEYTPLVGEQYRQQIALAFKSNNAPDIWSTNVGDGDAFKKSVVEGKWALPLDKWVTPTYKKNFPIGAFADGVNEFDGKTVSLPWGGAAECCYFMFINAKIFKEVGLVDAKGNVRVPKSWAEQRRFAKQIFDKSGGKYYGVGFGAKQGDFAINGVASGVQLSGVTTFDHWNYFDYNAGKHVYNNPQWRAWFSNWIDMKTDGTIYPQSAAIDDEQARVLFGESKFAMYYNGTWVPGSLAKTNPTLKESTDYIAAMPPTQTGKLTSWHHQQGADALWAISSQTKNAEAAWKVMEFLHGKASATRWASYGEGLRVYPETAKVMTGVSAQLATLGQQKIKEGPNFNAVRPQLADVKRGNVAKGTAYWILSAFNGQLKKADVTKTLQQIENDFNNDLTASIAAAQKAGIKVTREDFMFPMWKPLEDQSTSDLKAAMGIK